MAASVTSSYGGEFLETIVTLMTLGNPTVENGHIRVHSGVNSKISIPRIKATNLVQPYKPSPVTGDSGTLTFDEAAIITGGYMLYAEYDPESFASFWRPFQPEGSAFVFQELPQSVQMAIMSEFLRIHGEQLENIIWQGDTALSSDPLEYFDGIFKVASADASVIDVATPVVLTDANIVGELGRVFDAAPARVKASPDWKIFCSIEDWYLYGTAQRNKANKGSEDWQEPPRLFRGKQLVPTAGVPKDKILACVASADMSSNLHFAIKFRNDFNQIKAGKLAANSEMEFMKMAFKGGVQFSWGEEVVAYNA
jgi:hypothetical protein